MDNRTRHVRIGAVALLLGLAATLGCGGVSPTGGGDDFQTRRLLGQVATFYGDFLAERGAPPKDEAAFRAFLQERSQQLERMKLDVDSLLTSPRDGQPFVVVYGKRVAPAASPNTPWAAYEQTGVDGKRLAAQVRGQIVEMTSEEIASQLESSGKKK
jgi:hypothetical protein